MTFAEDCIQRQRAFRWANPSLTGDAFWQGMQAVIHQAYEEYHPAKAATVTLTPMKRHQINALNATLAEACARVAVAIGRAG